MENADKKDGGERAECRQRNVREMKVVVQRASMHEVHGERPDVHRGNPKADSDDEYGLRDREGADHAIERERSIQDFEVEKQEESCLARRQLDLVAAAVVVL